MIAGISGKIREKKENILFVESGNFVVKVLCPAPLAAAKNIGDAIFLHTFLSVREDDLSLFGFADAAEKDLFEKLISVSGIGPKTAIEILAAGFSAVSAAISAENVAFLQSIKGIGKKTAERAILELKEKMGDFAAAEKTKNPSFQDATAALENLGFSSAEISKKFREIPAECDTAEKIIAWFLKN